jgi:hypothetical protein
VCTDAAIEPQLLQALLRTAIEPTFNAITVDGDTSTNDTVLAFASGESGVAIEGDEATAAFATALQEILLALAEQVARDGEGATRLLEVRVTGAPTTVIAKAIARGCVRSSLFKCSVFAGEANGWGRLSAAAGQAALEAGYFELDARELAIDAQRVPLVRNGATVESYDHGELARRLREPTVCWEVRIGSGPASFTALGCDFSYDYVRINADDAPQIEVSPDGVVRRNLSLASYSPRLKHQLLVDGLAYVRRFMGLRMMVYVPPLAQELPGLVDNLAQDLELCLDANLRPLLVVPSERMAQGVHEHMKGTGHYSAPVAPDPSTINRLLDRGHLCVLVRDRPVPHAVVDLAIKLGMGKLIAMGAEQGLRDAYGFVQRLSPESFLMGLERDRFSTQNPDLLVLAKHAATRGVPSLHLVDVRLPHALVGELFTDEGIGTLITRQTLG